MIALNIHGTPAPKGSARAINRGGRAVLVPSSSNVNRNKQRAWVERVKAAARRLDPIAGPVWVSLSFRLARPSGHYGRRGVLPSAPLWPSVKPDIDKLARCTLDALTGLAYEDDARIVSLSIGKSYAEPGDEGCAVKVGAWVVELGEVSEVAA